MFNLLVRGAGWDDSRDSLSESRVFEHTDPAITERFKPNGKIDYSALIGLPSLFVQEGKGDEIARVGTITRTRVSGPVVNLQYTFDPEIPGLTNRRLLKLAPELDIDEHQFYRTHWSVKEPDLFQVLLRNAQPRRQRPRVFRIEDSELIEPTLVSAMMPFNPGFDGVYATLKGAADSANLRCRRADDIWENPEVIQDVVSLIDKSAVIICDCTGRNPNVFYEIGIAHTLGREVILITQSQDDIPFDLRHLRFVKYLNNGEGLRELKDRIQQRLVDLTGSGA